jgi:hypothetical protein
VKDKHKEKRILFEIKHGKLDGYIQKKKLVQKHRCRIGKWIK